MIANRTYQVRLAQIDRHGKRSCVHTLNSCLHVCAGDSVQFVTDEAAFTITFQDDSPFGPAYVRINETQKDALPVTGYPGVYDYNVNINGITDDPQIIVDPEASVSMNTLATAALAGAGAALLIGFLVGPRK